MQATTYLILNYLFYSNSYINTKYFYIPFIKISIEILEQFSTMTLQSQYIDHL